ncbi:MAG: exonuclease domain-containing protein [Solirubrobacterales bacterium]
MRLSDSRQVTWTAAIAAAFLLAFALLAALPKVAGWVAPLWLVGALGVFAWFGLMLAYDGWRHHAEDLKLLQSALEAVAAGHQPPEQLATRFHGKGGHAAERLAVLVSDIATRRALDSGKPDQRLASVIAAMTDGVVVVTDSGLVSLINAAAKRALGAERAAVGKSIWAAVDRDSLAAAMAGALEGGRGSVETLLRTVDGTEVRARVGNFGEHRGAVITMPAAETEHVHAVEVALDLHDVPPAAPAPGGATPLDELPVTVLDTETTGLDVKLDRIVSVGAVRVHGARIFRSAVIDRLVDPGKHIPARSTAVHGITDAMVAGQPAIAATLPEVMAMLQNTVVVGHNIGFDLALLRRSAEEAGLAWVDPPWLDTILLAGALEPEQEDLNLDAVAARMGVSIQGRHTALGDSLVTAEIYVRMLALLGRRGIKTLADAVAFSQKARHIIAQQRAVGW